ncbi:MAG: PEP-CTERM sorting domain-containing protein [Sedimenticola sp.]
MNKLVNYMLSAAILFVSLPSNASVIWQLNNFVFDDGATAVGSFEWDEASNTAISWNIDILPVLSDSPGSYSDATGTSHSYAPLDTLTFQEGDYWQFRLGFADLDLLDTPVASLSLYSQNTGLTGDYGFLECENCNPWREGMRGAYLSPAIPEPATLALMGLGLAGIGFARKIRAT